MECSQSLTTVLDFIIPVAYTFFRPTSSYPHHQHTPNAPNYFQPTNSCCAWTAKRAYSREIISFYITAYVCRPQTMYLIQAMYRTNRLVRCSFFRVPLVLPSDVSVDQPRSEKERYHLASISINHNVDMRHLIINVTRFCSRRIFRFQG